MPRATGVRRRGARVRRAQKRGNGEGSVFYREDRDKWIAQVAIDGKQRYPSFDTREDAERYAELVQERSAADLRGYSPEQPLAQFLASWLEGKYLGNEIRFHTYEVYVSEMKTHVLPSLGHVPLSKLRPAHFDHLKTEMFRKGKSTQTVQNVLMRLRSAFKKAVQLRLLIASPLDGVAGPKVIHAERHALNDDDLAALLTVSQGTTWFALWALMGTTGVRVNEALALRWQDIDFGHRHLAISHSLTRSPAGGLTLGPPKTTASTRGVRLGDVAYEALRDHKRLLTGDSEGVIGWRQDDPVFPGLAGGWMYREAAARALVADCKRAGIPVMRPHELRHTAATSHLSAGEPIPVVQKMLGHASIKETVDTYGHVTPAMHQEAMARMDERLRRRMK